MYEITRSMPRSQHEVRGLGPDHEPCAGGYGRARALEQRLVIATPSCSIGDRGGAHGGLGAEHRGARLGAGDRSDGADGAPGQRDDHHARERSAERQAQALHGRSLDRRCDRAHQERQPWHAGDGDQLQNRELTDLCRRRRAPHAQRRELGLNPLGKRGDGSKSRDRMAIATAPRERLPCEVRGQVHERERDAVCERKRGGQRRGHDLERRERPRSERQPREDPAKARVTADAQRRQQWHRRDPRERGYAPARLREHEQAQAQGEQPPFIDASSHEPSILRTTVT